MSLPHNEVKSILKAIGFYPKEGKKDIYQKLYDNYFINVDFSKNKIDYGDSIKVGDLTTSNFENSENFVVLECVDRLIEKGYPPPLYVY